MSADVTGQSPRPSRSGPRAIAVAAMGQPPLGLYVHIPWCVRKCPYCDFNSHSVRDELPEQAYIAALLDDLERELAHADGRAIQTIFLGGGTPSLFSGASIAVLLSGIRARAAVAPDCEITLEANPGTVEAAKFAAFRAAGVNRLSIGVQSFRDASLRKLGRIHGGSDAMAAAQVAYAAGFDNVNLDLMFGLPGQTLDDAVADVRSALELAPTHISLYQLTVEPNTPFYRDPPRLPDDDLRWEMQIACQSALAESGYAHYEVSAYARSGYRCRHNVNYWRFGDYLGVGAGAHGKVTDAASGSIRRRVKVKHPAHYLNASATARVALDFEVLPIERPLEFLMNALRLKEGFPTATFTEYTGLSLTSIQPELERCIAEGWLESSHGYLRATQRGWIFLDEILQRFIPEDASQSGVPVTS